MKKIPRQIIITKKDTSSNYISSEYFDTNTNNSDDSDFSSDNYKEIPNNSKKKAKSAPKKNFKSIVSLNYKKPKQGTKQDNYTKEDIIKQLNGFIPLRTIEEKKILTQLPIFRSWIKYINLDTKQFRVGGFLMKVNYPDYITLVNTRTNISWSVQLNNTIIYIRDPRKKEETTMDEYDTDTYYTDTYTYTETTNNEIDIIKDKLYKLYLKGQLTTKK